MQSHDEDSRIKIQKLINELPDVREQMVRDLKRRIEKSTYRPDTDRLSELLLEDALQSLVSLKRSPMLH